MAEVGDYCLITTCLFLVALIGLIIGTGKL